MKKHLVALTPLFVVLPCLISPAGAAQAVHAEDVKSFDIGGVKSGMSVEHACAAMLNNFLAPLPVKFAPQSQIKIR